MRRLRKKGGKVGRNAPRAVRRDFIFADRLNFRKTGSTSCIAWPTLFSALPGSFSSFLRAAREAVH